MSSATDFQVRQLADDDRCWRVDWIGSVTFAERYRRPSQPLIEIQFSLVADDLVDEDTLFNLRRDQWPATKQLRLPVGLLPMFKVGDFWRCGKLVKSPDYDIADFHGLAVGGADTSLIKAGLPQDEGVNYYLPIGVHPYHLKHTQSYCVHVKLPTCHLIVPSSELIRFYFGSSSTLTARLFDAPLTPENLWQGIETFDSRGSPKIHLAPGISGRSASDIARIALSKEARAAAELIGHSCIAATANGERAYPKGVFPFSGNTDLVASGKWLPFDGNERGVFLVFKLLSCSYPFPFTSLRYTSERAGASNPPKGADEPRSADERPSMRFSKASVTTKAIVDDEPDKARKTIRFSLITERRQFPDLARKQISKTETDQTPTVVLSKSGTTIFSGVAVGDSGRDVSIKPLDLVSTFEDGAASTKLKGIAPFAAVLLSIASKLRDTAQFTSVDIVRLSPRQRFEYLSLMPQIVDDDGEVSPACLLTRPAAMGDQKSTTRYRHVSVGRAARLYDTTYFFIPEPQDAQNQIELHLIVDSGRTIREAPDLLTAIATHFSDIGEFGKPLQLMPGTTSVAYRSINVDAAVEAIADDLLWQARCI